SSTAALSGGNNRATARSLNACPYRANSCPSSPPPDSWFYGGDNYSDAGGITVRVTLDETPGLPIAPSPWSPAWLPAAIADKDNKAQGSESRMFRDFIEYLSRAAIGRNSACFVRRHFLNMNFPPIDRKVRHPCRLQRVKDHVVTGSLNIRTLRKTHREITNLESPGEHSQL
ncbi:hypothetical protein, partial [Polaromonas sp. AER18D-145]|uniref:hypothetical protein n=1 Tax=Polaromonas sp. AER18D-145 TaxID=1977060 RepID=UPI00197BB714